MLESWLFWLGSISVAFMCGAILAWIALAILYANDAVERSREFEEWMRKDEVDYE